MLVLPSVGASVRKIVLNESATKAKLYFDDGTSTIIHTTNTPTKKSKSVVMRSPNTVVRKKTTVVKKQIPAVEGIRFKKITTHQGTMNVPMVSDPKVLEEKAQSVLARAKRRAEMLESQTMDASARMAMNAPDGQEVELTPNV